MVINVILSSMTSSVADGTVWLSAVGSDMTKFLTLVAAGRFTVLVLRRGTARVTLVHLVGSLRPLGSRVLLAHRLGFWVVPSVLVRPFTLYSCSTVVASIALVVVRLWGSVATLVPLRLTLVLVLWVVLLDGVIS
jgi:hypothetical protein